MDDRGAKGEAGGGGRAIARVLPLAVLLVAGASSATARTGVDTLAIVPVLPPETSPRVAGEMVLERLPASAESRSAAPRTAVDGRADWVAPRRRGPRPDRLRSFPVADGPHRSRALFGTIDAATFRLPQARASLSDPFALAGIGFPQVERRPSENRRHHRRFRPLLDWRGDREPHARVRCMNYPSHVVTRRAAPYASTIERLAEAHGLAPSLVMAVVARESCFDPRAVSRVGAMGLMQLMPATARELRVGDPWKPLDNLDAGIRYLAAMLERFGSVELALAAYNAGPGNVARHGGIPPFAETRAYVVAVLAYERRYRALALVAAL